jgi:hypothetical protein
MTKQTTPAGPRVTLKRHVAKDGTQFAQDEIYLELGGKSVRVGYAGHGEKGGIVFIRRVTDEQLMAKLGSWPTKTAFAPAIGDLVDDVPPEEPEEAEDELE